MEPTSIEAPFTVEVVRSTRRKRSVSAQLIDGVLRISVPSWMNAREIDEWTAKWTAAFQRKLSADRIDLPRRAHTLARRYDLPRASEVVWADDMTSRWGTCTPSTGQIRISNRLAAFPDWVVDYVIVHELAHLREIGHGPEFWRLVQRFPRAERAMGYLLAKSGDTDTPD
jgi:predicted metal-dependent hydrolase